MVLKILVVGSGGQLGSNIVRIARSSGNVVFGGFLSRPPGEGIDSFLLDKTKEAQVRDALARVHPDVVIDTGALHNVDYCEAHPDEAYAVNADGTERLARLSTDGGSRYIFVSTDYVCDGTKGLYEEDDPPNPLSVYAASKLEGERGALRQGDSVSVVRPSVIYSWMATTQATSSSGKPLNFAMWLLEQLRGGSSVRIVKDQVASPTLAEDLAASIMAIAEAKAGGVFHTAGKTPLSRYDFAMRLARLLDLDSGLITPTTTSELHQVARRPMNSSLVSTRIEREVGYEMMRADRALEAFRRRAEDGAKRA